MNPMIRGAQRLYHALVPERVRWGLSEQLKAFKYKDIVDKATSFLLASDNAEYRQVGAFLKKHGANMFPYEYALEYKPEQVQVAWDAAANMHYVLIEGKKLYARQGMLPSKIKTMINSLLMEQDPASPHAYTNDLFNVAQDNVLYDVGAAEGIFALMNIEKVKHAYLFEVDEQWISALRQTFLPWKEKVTIVNKYVGDKDMDQLLTLDSFVKDHLPPDFIKADIEGAEIAMLYGAKEILQSGKPLKLAVCTYHSDSDAADIEGILKLHKMTTAFTPGYMFCYHVQPEKPYLRKVVVRSSTN